MRPRFERRQRALTPEEILSLESSVRDGPIATGCWYLVMLVFLGWLPAFVIGWLGRLINSGLGSHFLFEWGGWIFGASLFVASVVSFRRASQDRAAWVQIDVRRGVVEVLDVHDAVSIYLDSYSDEEPEPDEEQGPLWEVLDQGSKQLAIQVGPGVLLLLKDEELETGWLFDWQTYCTDPCQMPMEWCSDHFNCFPEPYAFPCARFTLERLPESGRVLRIDVQSEYLAPEEGRGTVDCFYFESELIEGDLSSLRG